jgi:phytoene desaturase
MDVAHACFPRQRELAADVVVNGDSAWTYRNLIPPGTRPMDQQESKTALFDESLCLVFRHQPSLRHVAHHTILLGPRYKRLVDDIFVRHARGRFSLYLHRQQRIRASHRRMRQFYVCRRAQSHQRTNWDKEQGDIRKSVETISHGLPNLGKHVSAPVFSPHKCFRTSAQLSRGRVWSGTGAGTERVLPPHNVSEDVDRLYLVGAGTHPGAGLPGVLSSARVLDSVVPDAAALV